MRVQLVNMTREYHVVFAHLFSGKREKGEKSRPTIDIRTPREYQQKSLVTSSRIKLTNELRCDGGPYDTRISYLGGSSQYPLNRLQLAKNPSTDLRAARTAKSLESTDSIHGLHSEVRSV